MKCHACSSPPPQEDQAVIGDVADPDVTIEIGVDTHGVTEDEATQHPAPHAVAAE
jgi:hypothetical protein